MVWTAWQAGLLPEVVVSRNARHDCWEVVALFEARFDAGLEGSRVSGHIGLISVACAFVLICGRPRGGGEELATPSGRAA